MNAPSIERVATFAASCLVLTLGSGCFAPRSVLTDDAPDRDGGLVDADALDAVELDSGSTRGPGDVADAGREDARIDASGPSMHDTGGDGDVNADDDVGRDADANAALDDAGCELDPRASLALDAMRWQAMSELGAPAGRTGHTATWSGDVMLIWGGNERFVGSAAGAAGARYDPDADRWLPVATSDAPSARSGHTAVWTGEEVLVWGGLGLGAAYAGDGARYDPVADRWSALSPLEAPSARTAHSATWTGEEMLVWGGFDGAELADGAAYDPATDRWRPLPAAPLAARHGHGAVWTGRELLVWGGTAGVGGDLGDGAAYDPATDRWRGLGGADAPSPRWLPMTAWTGCELLVWAGFRDTASLSDGRLYDPARSRWRPIEPTGAPAFERSAAWTWAGDRFFVWGGRAAPTGSLFDPTADVWYDLPLEAAPSARSGATAVWTGDRVLVWGGIAYDGAGHPVAGARLSP